MAQPDIIRGTYFSLMLGNGAEPEVFTALCGIETRSFVHQANTNDRFVRDCAAPEDVPVRRVIVTGEQWDLTGTGVVNRANLATIQAAMKIQRNWRYLFTEPGSDLVFQGFYAGPGIMTRMEITAADESFANLSIAIASDGEWTWTTV